MVKIIHKTYNTVLQGDRVTIVILQNRKHELMRFNVVTASSLT